MRDQPAFIYGDAPHLPRAKLSFLRDMVDLTGDLFGIGTGKVSPSVTLGGLVTTALSAAKLGNTSGDIICLPGTDDQVRVPFRVEGMADHPVAVGNWVNMWAVRVPGRDPAFAFLFGGVERYHTAALWEKGPSGKGRTLVVMPYNERTMPLLSMLEAIKLGVDPGSDNNAL